MMEISRTQLVMSPSVPGAVMSPVVCLHLAAVIATVVLVLLALVLVVVRYIFRHKGSYLTNEAKGTEFADTADIALRSDPALKDAMDQSRKEYFI